MKMVNGRSEQWEEDQQPFLMGLTKAELLSNKRHRTAATSGQAFQIFSSGTPSTLTPPQGNNEVFPRSMNLNSGGGLPIFLPGTPVTYLPLGGSNVLQPHAGFPRMNHNLNNKISLLGSNNSFAAARPRSSHCQISPDFGLFSSVNGNEHRDFSDSVRPKSLVFGQGLGQMSTELETRLHHRTLDRSSSTDVTRLQALHGSASVNEARLQALNHSASADDIVWVGLGPSGSSLVGTNSSFCPRMTNLHKLVKWNIGGLTSENTEGKGSDDQPSTGGQGSGLDKA